MYTEGRNSVLSSFLKVLGDCSPPKRSPLLVYFKQQVDARALGTSLDVLTVTGMSRSWRILTPVGKVPVT